MLINLRNAMMAGKRLPYDAEVEYLESTGTQWIDTAVQTADKVQMGVWVNTTGYDMKIWGNSYYLGGWADISWFQSVYRGTRIPQVAQTWDTITIEKSPKRLTIDRGGETFSASSWWAVAPSGGGDTARGTAVPLFGHTNRYGRWYGDNRVATWDNSSYHLRISFFKAWSNGVLVRDFIPVRRGNVGYLYDRVSGKLFGNAGTGDFVLGQDVVPVEWLEFTGTQRLLTDITPNAYARNLKTSISYQLTSTASRQLSGSDSAYFEFCSNDALVQVDASYPADLNRHTLDFIGWETSNSSRVLYDGQNISPGGFVRSTNTSNHFTFGSLKADSQSNPLKAIVYSLSMEYQDATRFLYWHPVRVGTEGAMIDTLTRRIYRNAGTGAFGYGNDLKYPIPAS